MPSSQNHAKDSVEAMAHEFPSSSNEFPTNVSADIIAESGESLKTKVELAKPREYELMDLSSSPSVDFKSSNDFSSEAENVRPSQLQFCLETPEQTPKPPLKKRKENPDLAVFSRDVNEPGRREPLRQRQKVMSRNEFRSLSMSTFIGSAEVPPTPNPNASASGRSASVLPTSGAASFFSRSSFSRQSFSVAIAKLPSKEQLSEEGRKVLHTGVEKLQRTFQDIRTGLGTLGQRFRTSTRRRERLNSEAYSPAAMDKYQGSLPPVPSTPIRLYSPFAIESPGNRVAETAKSKESSSAKEPASSPLSSVASFSKGRRFRLFPASDAITNFDSPSRRFGQDVANLNQEIGRMNIVANRVVLNASKLPIKSMTKRDSETLVKLPSPPKNDDKENELALMNDMVQPKKVSSDVILATDQVLMNFE